jgi:hypothetical protein
MGNVLGLKPIPFDRITQFEKGLHKLLKNNFIDSHKFAIRLETKIYKPSEDLSIRAQKLGKRPTAAEIYYENEYLCDVYESQKPYEVLEKITHFLKLYITKKINKYN